MKIIIFGAKGMLGRELVEVFKCQEVECLDITEINITDKKAVKEKILKVKPQIVINAAAYTNVDNCEIEKSLAVKVNGNGVVNLAKACRESGAVLIHYSTDYVFDGLNKKGYTENEKQNPINYYGYSKLLGEKAILEEKRLKFYLIRTSWLYGKYGKNFISTILQIAKENDKLNVVNDQFGKPTSAKDLAEMTKKVIEEKREYGIYHISNEGVCSWFDLAKKSLEFAKIKTPVFPIDSNGIKRLAKRPNYSVLLNTKFPKLRNWEKAVFDYVEEIMFDLK